jgi:hypothetical protein
MILMGHSKREIHLLEILAVVEFVIAVSTFFSTWILYNFPVAVSFLLGVAVLFSLFVITDAASRFTLHSRFLAPFRKRLLYWLSGVSIVVWHVILEISEEGSAIVTDEFSGQVNFGNAQWLILSVWTGKEQPKDKPFGVSIYDFKRQREQQPEIIFDESRYKKIKIRFANPLKRGDKFHYRVRYKLENTFYFDQEDYYDFESVHHEKEIHMKVIFPESTKIEYTRGEIATEHGDVWEEHERPQVTADPHEIEWKIRYALHGNHHKLCWKVCKKKT